MIPPSLFHREHEARKAASGIMKCAVSKDSLYPAQFSQTLGLGLNITLSSENLERGPHTVSDVSYVFWHGLTLPAAWDGPITQWPLLGNERKAGGLAVPKAPRLSFKVRQRPSYKDCPGVMNGLHLSLPERLEPRADPQHRVSLQVSGSHWRSFGPRPEKRILPLCSPISGFPLGCVKPKPVTGLARGQEKATSCALVVPNPTWKVTTMWP